MYASSVDWLSGSYFYSVTGYGLLASFTALIVIGQPIQIRSHTILMAGVLLYKLVFH